MSRRYGRNQKRKARQEIERLERARDYWEDRHGRDTMSLAQTVQEQRYALDNVAMALGENFIGLPPREIAWKVGELADPDDFVVPVSRGRTVMARTMGYQVREWGDRPQDRVHFLVRLAGERVGYALADDALYRCPPKLLARNIADQMAELLVRDIVARRGGSRR